jgi:fructoselysine-6-P-deglycase FrlB-like protein
MFSYFLTEIKEQISLWEGFPSKAKKWADLKEKLHTFDVVLATGRGSSLHAAYATVPHTFTDFQSHSHPRSKRPLFLTVPPESMLEILEKFLNLSQKTSVLLYSASGKSSEIVDLASQIKSDKFFKVAVTNAGPSSPLSLVCQHSVCLEMGSEQAVPASKSFSGQWLFSKWIQESWTAQEMDGLVTLIRSGDLEPIIQEFISKLKQDVRQVWWLHDSKTMPVWLDACLKTQEVLGWPSQSKNAKEFMHGPIGSCKSQDIIFLFAPLYASQNTSLIQKVKQVYNIEVVNLIEKLPSILYKNSLLPLAGLWVAQQSIAKVAEMNQINADCPAGLNKVTHF